MTTYKIHLMEACFRYTEKKKKKSLIVTHNLPFLLEL